LNVAVGICFLENTGAMILCTLTTYQTQAKERDELHGDFLMPVLLFWPFIFQFIVHHTTSNKNTVPDQEIQWLPILETTCNPDFLCPSLRGRVVWI